MDCDIWGEIGCSSFVDRVFKSMTVFFFNFLSEIEFFES